jgi:signal transduction histidine kinase
MEKTDSQLKDELIRTRQALVQLRQRITELEEADSERRRVEESLLRRNREMALLSRVGQELAATLELREVIARLLEEVIDIVGSESGSAWLWADAQEGSLVCWAISSEGKDSSPIDVRLLPGQGIAGWVAETGESIVVNDVTQSTQFFPGVDEQIDFQTRSLIAVPMRVRGGVVGVVEVVNKLEGEFDATDLGLVETLASSAAIAVDNVKMLEALREYAAELEARNEDLDAFAHTVAHDLNNPLTRIIGFAEVMNADFAELSEADLRRYLGSIARAARKMNSITEELLLLSSVRAMEEVQVGPLEMERVVSEALIRVAYLIESHQAELMLPDSWPTAVGYGPWVEEVWANYISNAVKYGGQPPRVELGATDGSDGTICFWVRDNGPGLSEEEQARLFTPFTRLSKATVQGYGLGLSIVRRIMEKLGGTVGVESSVGGGSRFTFTLPGIEIGSS